ncbi:MAG TPA: hypothetical protein VHE81_04090, partial [Lacipirellulaceae bacterium]|nr:hypothetical protein [Lacipirellulaceae bacterium]
MASDAQLLARHIGRSREQTLGQGRRQIFGIVALLQASSRFQDGGQHGRQEIDHDFTDPIEAPNLDRRHHIDGEEWGERRG